jgi:hypothetical protein
MSDSRRSSEGIHCEILINADWMAVREDAASILDRLHDAGAREWLRLTDWDTGDDLYFPPRMIDGIAEVGYIHQDDHDVTRAAISRGAAGTAL